MYDELVKRLRNCATQAAPCDACGLIGDISCSDNLMKQAANAIEELHQKLCDWCGVCPKERRRPYECEIIYPKMQVPEVSIVPPKDGES